MLMSALESEALAHLATCALSRGFVAEVYGTGSLLLTFDVPHVDGVRVQYRIVVDVDGPHLFASEEPGDAAPARVFARSGTLSRVVTYACIGPATSLSL